MAALPAGYTPSTTLLPARAIPARTVRAAAGWSFRYPLERSPPWLQPTPPPRRAIGYSTCARPTQCPALHRPLMGFVVALMAMMARTSACNRLHAVPERLAKWLLLVHDRVTGDELPLTHEFLGIMLGVRRASVTVAANALRDVGAI